MKVWIRPTRRPHEEAVVVEKKDFEEAVARARVETRTFGELSASDVEKVLEEVDADPTMAELAEALGGMTSSKSYHLRLVTPTGRLGETWPISSRELVEQ